MQAIKPCCFAVACSVVSNFDVMASTSIGRHKFASAPWYAAHFAEGESL